MKCILWCGRLVLILLEMMKQRRAAGAKEGCEVCLSGNLRKDHIWEWKSHVGSVPPIARRSRAEYLVRDLVARWIGEGDHL